MSGTTVTSVDIGQHGVQTETQSTAEEVEIKLEPGLDFVNSEEKQSLGLLRSAAPIIIDFPQLTPTSPIEIKCEFSDSATIVGSSRTDNEFQTRLEIDRETWNGRRRSLRLKLQRQKGQSNGDKNEDIASDKGSDTFHCETCGRTFTGKDWLTDHILRIHSGGENQKGNRVKKEYICRLCRRVFLTKKWFKNHAKAHNR